MKVIAEDLKNGERKLAATAFLTFVGLDENKQPARVPDVIPETEEEKRLHETAPERSRIRRERKEKSKEWLKFYSTVIPGLDPAESPVLS